MEMVSNARRVKPSWMQSILNRVLSSDNKRLIFISSLYAKLHQRDDHYAQMRGLADINERLDLSDSVSSLVFPARRCVSCWDNLALPDGALENEDIDSLVRRVLTSAPWWLEYRSKSDMAADIKKLLARNAVVAEKKVVQLYS